MLQNYLIRFTSLLLLISSLFLSTNLYAKDNSSFDKVNIVIHVSNNHKRTYQSVLNYTYSLMDYYGEKANIAIVANGTGIGFVNSKNKYTEEILNLIEKGVKISACNTTVRIMRKFQALHIIKGVKFVPTGVVEVIELQLKGYLYLNP